MKTIKLTDILNFIDNLADNFPELPEGQKNYALICLVYAEGILDKGRGLLSTDNYEEEKSEINKRLDKSRAKISEVLKTFDQAIAKEVLSGAGQSLSYWIK